MIDDGRNYFRVGSMKAGGALAKDGRVKPGDKLVWVDGFDCTGVPRADIKERVKGPAQSEIVLEFERAGWVFKVLLLRTPGCETRNSNTADRERGNGRDRDRDTDRTKDALRERSRERERERKRERERERDRTRESGGVRDGDIGEYRRDKHGQKVKIEQAAPEVAGKAPEAEGRGGKGEAAASRTTHRQATHETKDTPNFGKSAQNFDEAIRSRDALSSTLLSLSPAPQPAPRSKRRFPPCQNPVRLR